MIGIRSALSIRARGQWPHLEAVYMTAPRSLAEIPRKLLPRGGRPYMTARMKQARHTPAKAGYPVRRGLSVRSLLSLEYWSPAFAGDDKEPNHRTTVFGKTALEPTMAERRKTTRPRKTAAR